MNRPMMTIEVLEAEVERLKKDFSGQLEKAKRAGQYAFNNGLVEGERRAKELAADVFADIFDEYVDTVRHQRFLQRLGLGEESTDNNNYTNTKGEE